MKKRIPIVIVVFFIVISSLLVIKVANANALFELFRKDVANSPKKAPDWTLLDINGDEIRLSDFKGKVVLLDFLTTWCPSCRARLPYLVELYDEYKDEGLEIVGVLLDWDAEKVAEDFIEENGINYIVLIGDTSVSDEYGGISSIPTTFIIDRNGMIKKRFIGYRDKWVFEKEIKELLKESLIDKLSGQAPSQRVKEEDIK